MEIRDPPTAALQCAVSAARSPARQLVLRPGCNRPPAIAPILRRRENSVPVSKFGTGPASCPTKLTLPSSPIASWPSRNATYMRLHPHGDVRETRFDACASPVRQVSCLIQESLHEPPLERRSSLWRRGPHHSSRERRRVSRVLLYRRLRPP